MQRLLFYWLLPSLLLPLSLVWLMCFVCGGHHVCFVSKLFSEKGLTKQLRMCFCLLAPTDKNTWWGPACVLVLWLCFGAKQFSCCVLAPKTQSQENTPKHSPPCVLVL